jgi:hypothetical protein
VDNANKLRNLALTQAAGTAEREAAAAAQLESMAKARELLPETEGFIESLEESVAVLQAVGMEESAEELTCEIDHATAFAESLRASLAQDTGALKEAYRACGCAKCDTAACSCRKAGEVCGPACKCSGVHAGGRCACESPLTAMAAKFEAARARGQQPRPFAVLDASGNRNYEQVDWIQQTLTKVATANPTEFHDDAPQVDASERTADKVLGPMLGMLELQTMQNTEDVRYQFSAIRLLRESCDAAAAEAAGPSSSGASTTPPAGDVGDASSSGASSSGGSGSGASGASGSMLCGRAGCADCPAAPPFKLPPPKSDTERSINYQRSPPTQPVPPAKAAEFVVLPVKDEHFANPNNPDAMHLVCSAIDAALAPITGGAKLRMAAAAAPAQAEGGSDEDDDAMEVGSTTCAGAGAQRMASHCSICGHPGTKAAHKKKGCEACGTPAGTACAAGGPPCSCAAHRAAADAAAAAADALASMDYSFVPPVPWLAYTGSFDTVVPSLAPKLAALRDELKRIGGHALDGTVTTGWGALQAQVGQALSVYALAAGGGEHVAEREVEAGALLDAALASAAALDPTQRSARCGNGPARLYSQADQPLYVLQRLYLDVRHELGERSFMPAALHLRMSEFESAGHSNEHLGIRELIKSLALRTDGQVSWVEKCHSDIANAMEVYRMVYAAIIIVLLMRFHAHPPDSAAAACAATVSATRVELSAPGIAPASMWLEDCCAGVAADVPPQWLDDLVAAAAAGPLSVRCGSHAWQVSAPTEPALLSQLRDVVARCREIADGAAAAALPHFYAWLQHRCANNPTLSAWAQYASFLFLGFKYYETGRAGAAMSHVRNMLTSLTTLVFCADDRKPNYRVVSVTHAHDLNCAWTPNEREGLAFAATHALKDSEEGGHDVDEDEKMETTVGYSKAGADHAGHISETTVQRAVPNCIPLKKLDSHIREQYSVRTSTSHFRAQSGRQICELVAALHGVDLLTPRCVLENVFTGEVVADASLVPAAASRHAIASTFQKELDALAALCSGPPPSSREADAAKQAQKDVPVDLVRLLAQRTDKAAKQAPEPPKPPKPVAAPRKRRRGGTTAPLSDGEGAEEEEGEEEEEGGSAGSGSGATGAAGSSRAGASSAAATTRSAAAAAAAARPARPPQLRPPEAVRATLSKALQTALWGGQGTEATALRVGASSASESAAAVLAAQTLGGGFRPLGVQPRCTSCGGRRPAAERGESCAHGACRGSCCQSLRAANAQLGECARHRAPAATAAVMDTT